MDEIKNNITELGNVLNLLLKDDLAMQSINQITRIITDAYRNGNQVVFCGNGGSAAEAQHLSAELSGRFKMDRRPLPAHACHANSSFMTAVSNDLGFSEVYARYIDGFCQKGDVLFGLSTSGDSGNIVAAFIQAGKMGMTNVALTGSTGGKLAMHADVLIKIPSTNVPRIQEVHLMIGHIICEMVEKNLFGHG